MSDEVTRGGGDLERAADAIRRSAAGASPSADALRSVLAALDGVCRDTAATHGTSGRSVLRSARGGLSVAEDALMRKWRMHDAFRPLSFEALERRRLLAATTGYQDDPEADRRPAWPDSFLLPAVHPRADRPQRRWDAHHADAVDGSLVSESASPTDRPHNDLRSSGNLFGSELIFAA